MKTKDLKKDNEVMTEELGRLASENMSLKEELGSLQSATKYIQDELNSFKRQNYALSLTIDNIEYMLDCEKEKRSILKQKYKRLKLKIANLLIK